MDTASTYDSYDSTWIPGIAFALMLLGLLLKYCRQDKLQLPPGPGNLKVIGSLPLLSKKPWLKFQDWTGEYGSIFSFRLGLKRVIVLGSYKTADDLLNKRSKFYSSRPRMEMARECVTQRRHVLFTPYEEAWQKMNKIQVACYGQRAAPSYQHIFVVESKKALLELLSGVSHADTFHLYAASVMFNIGYGHRCETVEDERIHTANQVVQNLIKAATNNWLVDMLPSLNRLPTFLAPWKHTARCWYQLESSWLLKTLQDALSSNTPNCAKTASIRHQIRAEDEMQFAYDVGIIAEAGIDTTYGTLTWFALAAALNPLAVKTAQEEIDREIGFQRLPEFADEEKLPYTRSLIKEVLRWRPVIAGGIPHAVTKDDEYMGYHIPRGATLVANHWSIMMDKKTFESPEKFLPDRWLQHPGLPWCPFGFGRRACIGENIAWRALFTLIAPIVAAFEFKRPRRDGNPISFNDMSSLGTFSVHPIPFDVDVQPRSVEHGERVREHCNSDQNIESL